MHSSVSTPAFSPVRVSRSSGAHIKKHISPSTAPTIVAPSINTFNSGQFNERDLVEYSRPSTSAMMNHPTILTIKPSNLELAAANERTNETVNKYKRFKQYFSLFFFKKLQFYILILQRNSKNRYK